MTIPMELKILIKRQEVEREIKNNISQMREYRKEVSILGQRNFKLNNLVVSYQNQIDTLIMKKGGSKLYKDNPDHPLTKEKKLKNK